LQALSFCETPRDVVVYELLLDLQQTVKIGIIREELLLDLLVLIPGQFAQQVSHQ
jgi:hypothetical protein